MKEDLSSRGVPVSSELDTAVPAQFESVFVQLIPVNCALSTLAFWSNYAGF